MAIQFMVPPYRKQRRRPVEKVSGFESSGFGAKTRLET